MPRIFAMYQDEEVEDRDLNGVAGWVVGMADGSATVFDPLTSKAYIHTTLRDVAQWWAPMSCAELRVAVPAARA